MKLFSSAIFAVVLLKRSLVPMQWASMLLLAGGVSAVQFSQTGASVRSSAALTAAAAAAAAAPVPVHCSLVGVLAVMCACLTSGLAGALMELLLKSATRSIWMRSAQFGVRYLHPHTLTHTHTHTHIYIYIHTYIHTLTLHALTFFHPVEWTCNAGA